MDATGIGAGASVVGGIIQSIAAAQAQKAMTRAFERELRRQNVYSNDATQAFHGTLQNDSVENANKLISEGAADRVGKYDALPQLGLNKGSQQDGRVAQNVHSNGVALGRLGGYSDWQMNRDIANILQQDKIDKTINFAGGTASVFPYRMNEAQHSQDMLAFIGQMVSAVGGSAPAWGQMFQAPAGTNGATPSLGGGYKGIDYTAPNVINPQTGQGSFGTMLG